MSRFESVSFEECKEPVNVVRDRSDARSLYILFVSLLGNLQSLLDMTDPVC